MQKPSCTVAVVGNPNTGKSTLFNALTGLNQKIGNYPGVTVEWKLGSVEDGETRFDIIDLPGTYSLAARSPDEQITLDCLMHLVPDLPDPDVILSIVDATNLERHLFVTSQLLSIGKPVVVAVNLMDLAAAKNIRIDLSLLSERLGVPVVPIQANKKIGLTELLAAIAQAKNNNQKPTFQPVFPAELDQLLTQIQDCFPREVPSFYLQRILFDIQGEMERKAILELGETFASKLQQIRQQASPLGLNLATLEAKTRYGWIRPIVADTVRRPKDKVPTISDRLDHVFTHRIWGTAIFFLIMFGLFQSIFYAATPLMDLIGEGKDWLSSQIQSAMSPGPLRNLITDGIFEGVGGVLVFLPQIMILFGFIAVLEDCGYMARAAFLMDRIMSRCGLNGKSFIPLLSSVACAVPGIMATRVIENRRDRFATILVAPLMSCSARLPLYLLMIQAFFPEPAWARGVLLFVMYLVGFITAPLVALILKKTILRGETPIFVMELPGFRVPQLRVIVRKVIDAGLSFIYRAGTMILATMILIWAVLYFPTQNSLGQSYPERIEQINEQIELAEPENAERLESERKLLLQEWKKNSYLGLMGQHLSPIFKPLGWNWQISVAAIASFPAREVVVGTLGMLYSQGEVDSGDEDSRVQLGSVMREEWGENWSSGIPVAFSLMVFFALCCQCVSTLAIIRRETRSWGWPLFTFVYMTLLAYIAALIAYQLLRLFF